MTAMADEDGTISRALDDLVEDIGAGRVAVLCGAGISWLSGLPTAGELIRAVLEELGVSGPDLERLIGPNDELQCPFELYVEQLRENGVDFLSELYGAGAPNPNHRLLAALARERLVQTIATTNF